MRKVIGNFYINYQDAYTAYKKMLIESWMNEKSFLMKNLQDKNRVITEEEWIEWITNDEYDWDKHLSLPFYQEDYNTNNPHMWNIPDSVSWCKWCYIVDDHVYNESWNVSPAKVRNQEERYESFNKDDWKKHYESKSRWPWVNYYWTWFYNADGSKDKNIVGKYRITTEEATCNKSYMFAVDPELFQKPLSKINNERYENSKQVNKERIESYDSKLEQIGIRKAKLQKKQVNRRPIQKKEKEVIQHTEDLIRTAKYLYCCNIAYLWNQKKIQRWGRIEEALYILQDTLFPLETPWYEMMNRIPNRPDTIDIYEEDRWIPMKMFICNSFKTKSPTMNYPVITPDYIKKLQRVKQEQTDLAIFVPWMRWVKPIKLKERTLVPSETEGKLDENWAYKPINKNDWSKWFYATWWCMLEDYYIESISYDGIDHPVYWPCEIETYKFKESDATEGKSAEGQPNNGKRIPVLQYRTMWFNNFDKVTGQVHIVPLSSTILSRCMIHPVAMKWYIKKYAQQMEYLVKLNIDVGSLM